MRIMMNEFSQLWEYYNGLKCLQKTRADDK